MLLILSSLQPAPAPSPVDQVAWIAGCWTLSAGGRQVLEQWIPPAGGTMLGVSRTVSGGKTVEYEFLLIRSGPRGLEYVARPSGQAETVFTQAEPVEGTAIVFENPAHDFPTRIHYRRDGDSLVATISGTSRGKPREIPFRFTACGP
jgi:hypothetical protein